jgi:hypothetical protein
MSFAGGGNIPEAPGFMTNCAFDVTLLGPISNILNLDVKGFMDGKYMLRAVILGSGIVVVDDSDPQHVRVMHLNRRRDIKHPADPVA